MKREDLFESIEKQILAEKVYRSQIRKKLGEFKVLQENKMKKQLIAEKIYRAKLRKEFASVAIELTEGKKTTFVHKTTGMNALEDLFSNTNLLSVLEGDYKILTTSYEQRRDYKERIMELVLDLFKQEEIGRDEESINESLHRLFEQEEPDIQITIDDEDPPEDKIVGPKRDEMEKEKEQAREDSENAAAIDMKQDATGVRRADLAFKKIENSIKTAYDTLGNPADQTEFKRFLIANLSMYFKQFEAGLSNEPKADIPADAQQAIDDAETKLSDEGGGTDDVGGDEELEVDLGDLEL
tara:strand:- start:41 stop:931 length:891 start_codon:yes stop_codon:yes gene_type:complete